MLRVTFNYAHLLSKINVVMKLFVDAVTTWSRRELYYQEMLSSSVVA
ncbi:hypothetical protein Glo7428_3892 [Gloeocapsa sp. PCC 7428]|nr:hypothetical protein Glo7428_3892 [Gloeocapsa sp. PCC 7428]